MKTIVVLVALLVSATAFAQCGYQPQQYGVWQTLTEIVIQPAPELTIGFYSGPVGPPRHSGLQPFFVPAPPPVFYYGGPPQYGNNGYNGGNPAFQQGYDSRWRQRAREQQEDQDRAAHAAGQRAADRAWGIGPTGGYNNGHRRR